MGGPESWWKLLTGMQFRFGRAVAAGLKLCKGRAWFAYYNLGLVNVELAQRCLLLFRVLERDPHF